MMEQQLGNYRLTRLLGRGGFADVYYGEHIYLKTPAAIKVLTVQMTQEKHKQFLTEAQIVARLEHPHIIGVLEFGVENNTPYLVMDYAANGTLRQRYPKGTQFAPRQITSYTQQIASALQYTHDQHLIHRDVKPENMLLGNHNDILLSDFGIARVVQNAQHIDEQQHIVGTIAYMAPEQLRGVPGPASDQYALGTVIYEWLCGEPPFYGSFTEVAVQHALVPPMALRKRVPQLSVAVEEVVMIALAKEPQARFKSIRAFATAFAQAATQGPQDALPSVPFMQASTFQESEMTTTIRPEERAVRKRPSRRTFAIGLGLLGGLVAGGVLTWKPLLAHELQTLIPAVPTPQAHLKPPTLAPGATLYTYHGQSGTTIFWSNDSKRIASASDNIQIWDATTGKLDKIYRFGPYYSASIDAMAWSPDNKYIAASVTQQASSGEYNVGLYILDAKTGKSAQIYHQSHVSTIAALAWSHNSTLLASANNDAYATSPTYTIQVWNSSTGMPLTTYRGHTSFINSLSWSPDGTLIASSDGKEFDSGNGVGTIHVWEAATGQTRIIYHGHPDPVVAVAWSPDGQHIASAGGFSDTTTKDPNNNTVQLWRPDSDKPLLIYRQHRGPVKAVAWSPDSKYIVSGSGPAYKSSIQQDTTQALVWDTTNGQTLLTYQGHNHQAYDGVTAVGWSPDGKLIASAGFDETIQVWKAI